MDVEEEMQEVGLGVRGVSLTMGGTLPWGGLVRVACIGVMKLDWGRGGRTPVGVTAGEGVGVCCRGRRGPGDGKGLGGPACAEDGRRPWGRGAGVAVPLLPPLRTPAAGAVVAASTLAPGGTRRGEAVGGGRGLAGKGEGDEFKEGEEEEGGAALRVF